MQKKVKELSQNKTIYKDHKSQLNIDDNGFFGEGTITMNFQFSSSSGDWLVLQNSHVKKLRELLKKSLFHKTGTQDEEQKLKGRGIKGDIFKKKDVLILGCSCAG